MKKKLYILDVSSYIFRAYFALPHMTNPRGEATNALFGFIRSVIKLLKDFNPEHIVAVFDGPDNKRQRLEIYEKYKANRITKQEDLPEQMEKALTFCELIGIPHVEIGGVEADDAMGSIAIWAKAHGAEVYLCTSDKDLCQLVQEDIYVLNTWKDNLILDSKKVEEAFGVPPERITDYLALTGDTSDNIPGVKGIGPKGASQLLQEFGSLENLYASLDQVTGKKKEYLERDEEAAKMSKRLATIYTDLEFPKDRSFFAFKKIDPFLLKEFYIDMGFNTLVQELEAEIKEQIPEEKTDYILVDSKEDLENLIEKLKREKEITFDVEATSLRPMEAELVGVGFSLKKAQAYYVPLNGKLGRKATLEALKPLFENSHIGFVGHNTKYDAHILANEGIPVENLSFDTMLASYLLNSGERRHSLDHLALHYFGKVKTSIKTLIGTGKKEITMDLVPLKMVSDYCGEDVDYTFRIKKILEDEIEKRQLHALLFDLELPLSRVLLKMERRGMYLEVSKLEELSKEISRELKILENEIYELAGEVFNISSPKQLSKILFEKMGIKPLKKTATGHSTRADVLEMLAEDHLIAAKIISFRVLEKLRTTYVETLPLEVNPKTGRIHPTFNQFVAATGRLACQDPNLQNIPVRTAQGRKIREAFRPQKRGWSYLAADYSQVELRLLAHLSEDPELIKAFKKGEDIHAYTASLVFGIPLNEVSAAQRHQAKAINFGIIYGQQAFGLATELGIEVRQAADFIKAYFERYPHVLKFVQASIEMARREKKAVTMIGRERKIPEIHSSNAIIRNAAERLAINTPLQGSAADLIKIAMLQIEALLEKNQMKSTMILQIHDELIFEVPDEEMEALKPLVKETMEGVFSLRVPLVVDLKVGKNWAEC